MSYAAVICNNADDLQRGLSTFKLKKGFQRIKRSGINLQKESLFLLQTLQNVCNRSVFQQKHQMWQKISYFFRVFIGSNPAAFLLCLPQYKLLANNFLRTEYQHIYRKKEKSIFQNIYQLITALHVSSKVALCPIITVHTQSGGLPVN